MTDLDIILAEAQKEIPKASSLRMLDEYRVHWLGKKGRITECLKQLGHLSPEEKPLAGQKINTLKQQVLALIEARHAVLEAGEVQKQLAADTVDVTLAGRHEPMGSLHPVNWTRHQVEAIFSRMGFQLAEGPEIEDDWHNFAALNIPALHPARAMQDTFYFPDHTLLRTHMSPVQIRTMRDRQPPLRIIAMGRVYRRDFDLTHTPMFHQVEGLIIDKNLGFTGLKGLLTRFLQEFFSKETKKVGIRFRASYFPFTEPSAEVDISCLSCEGSGCRICKHTGWLEVLGCGMVHPEVFRMAGIDSETMSGWAFGAGLDRLTMLRHGITDLRALFENDLRFLGQLQGEPS